MANVLEQYVNTVRSLSVDGQWCKLHEFVSKHVEQLVKQLPLLDTALGTLAAPVHSLGVLGLLLAKHSGGGADHETLLAQARAAGCCWSVYACKP